MEFNARKDKISLCEASVKSTAEHPIDCDITLPEYLPDIVRILRCTATPGVQSHRITGDRINAECQCRVAVLYICGEGKPHCFNQTLNFTKQMEWVGADSAEVSVTARTEYINHRVSGQRKFEVHGAISLSAKANEKKQYELVCDTQGGNVTSRSEEFSVCDLASVTEKAFTLTETVESGTLSEPIGSVISSQGSAVIDEIKIISEKIFLRGQLILRNVFTTEDTCRIETLDTCININQIIEAPDISENQEIDASLCVLCLDVRPRFDSAGNKNLLDISATIGLSAKGYHIRKITAIRDAYSTKYETDIKKAGIYTHCLEEKIEDTFLCRRTADLSSTGMSEILSFSCDGVTSAFSVTEDGILISGQITADIIYRDRQGDLAFAQRLIPYEYKRNLAVKKHSLLCRPDCTVTASSFVLSEGDTLDVRIEISVRGFVFSEEEKNVITEISVDTSRQKTAKNAALTVYFAEAGESLWDIAQRYNTTADAISRENKIDSAVTEKKCKLLIPRS